MELVRWSFLCTHWSSESGLLGVAGSGLHLVLGIIIFVVASWTFHCCTACAGTIGSAFVCFCVCFFWPRTAALCMQVPTICFLGLAPPNCVRLQVLVMGRMRSCASCAWKLKKLQGAHNAQSTSCSICSNSLPGIGARAQQHKTQCTCCCAWHGQHKLFAVHGSLHRWASSCACLY